MNFLKLLLVLGVAGGAFHQWKQRSVEAGSGASATAAASSGFVQLPRAAEQQGAGVYVVAAQDCPEDDAQRADQLAQDLSNKGIPVSRTHNVSFSLTGDDASQAQQRIASVMRGPLPIVFIGGRAKANPSLAEVVAEYGKGR